MQTLGLSDSTPKPEGRLRALLWPKIQSDIAAATAAQNAMYAGLAIAGITSIIVTLRLIPVTGLVDAALFAVLAIGVRQFSITASMLSLALYVANFVTSTLQGRTGSGFVIAVIVASLFLSAIRAGLYMRRHPELLQITLWTRIWRWTRILIFVLCGLAITLAMIGYLLPTNPGLG